MTTPRIDWFRVIVDLERSGLTQDEIAEHCGRSRVQVNAYKTSNRMTRYKHIVGTEPRFHVGMLLLELWAERTQRTPASWPYLPAS